MNESGATCVDLIIAQPKGKLKFTPLTVTFATISPLCHNALFSCLYINIYLLTFFFQIEALSSCTRHNNELRLVTNLTNSNNHKQCQPGALNCGSVCACHLLTFMFFSFSLSHTCSHMTQRVSSSCSSFLSFAFTFFLALYFHGAHSKHSFPFSLAFSPCMFCLFSVPSRHVVI